MFKKPLQLHSQSALSGKDVKTLIDLVLRLYPNITKDDLKERIGLHHKATITKKRFNVGHSKVILYEAENVPGANSTSVKEDSSHDKDEVTVQAGQELPIFFELTEWKLLPTVFTMWRLPNLCLYVETWGPVSEKIIAGADLMLPGVCTPFPCEFAQGDIRCIRVKHNQFPLAIGVMACSSDQALSSGMKGKGVVVHHYYGDELWAYGGKAVPDSALFTSSVVLEGKVADTNEPQSYLEQAKEGQPPAANTSSVEETEELPKKEVEVSSLSEKDISWMSDPNVLAERTFIQALHKLDDDKLPMEIRTFFSEHMLRRLPKGITLDLAQTRFKKIGKLIQQMKKSGLIKVVEENGNAEYIVKINRKEASYKNHEVWEDEVGIGAQSSERSMKDSSSKTSTKAGLTSAKALEVLNVWAATSDVLKVVLASANALPMKGKRGEMLFTESEAKRALARFCKENDLVNPDGKTIKVNDNKTLKDALFQNSKKTSSTGFPSELNLSEAWSQLNSHLIAYHVIQREGAEPIVRKGDVRPVKISLEQRHGGRKFLTNVSNLECFAINPTEFSESCQKRFSAASSIHLLQGKKDEHMVQIQGDVSRKIQDWLIADYGLSKQHIISLA